MRGGYPRGGGPPTPRGGGEPSSATGPKRPAKGGTSAGARDGQVSITVADGTGQGAEELEGLFEGLYGN